MKDVGQCVYKPFLDEHLESVFEIYRVAFPSEDLTPLVHALSGCTDAQSFIAESQDGIVGHIAFTECRLENSSSIVGLLGPLAVDPKFQRGGIGGGLIRTGFGAMRDRGCAVILVLGDPAYYGRFGFTQERAIKPPYELRAEWAAAWQSLWFADNAQDFADTLVVPEPWRSASLWR